MTKEDKGEYLNLLRSTDPLIANITNKYNGSFTEDCMRDCIIALFERGVDLQDGITKILENPTGYTVEVPLRQFLDNQK